MNFIVPLPSHYCNFDVFFINLYCVPHPPIFMYFHKTSLYPLPSIVVFMHFHYASLYPSPSCNIHLFSFKLHCSPCPYTPIVNCMYCQKASYYHLIPSPNYNQLVLTSRLHCNFLTIEFSSVMMSITSKSDVYFSQ